MLPSVSEEKKKANTAPCWIREKLQQHTFSKQVFICSKGYRAPDVWSARNQQLRSGGSQQARSVDVCTIKS